MPRIHLDRLPQLARRLQRFVKKVRRRLPVDRVIMHGSAARGDLTESSDIDLVFIGRFPISCRPTCPLSFFATTPRSSNKAWPAEIHSYRT